MGESVCLVRSFSQPAEISSRETDEVVVPRRVLTESVSFGRFASETLQWEKWSAFTQNRYLEEVERFTKPGSVAEKKAFFEAHFKNRASGRATKTKTEEANVKTIDEIVCETREDTLVDSEAPPLVVNNDGMAMDDEVRHEEMSSAEVDSVVTGETTVVQTGEVDVINVESFDSMAVSQDEALDQDNSTSLSKERRPLSSSGSKTCSTSSNLEHSFVMGLDLTLERTREEPTSRKKRSTSVSRNQNRPPPEPFHMSIDSAPFGNTDRKISRMPQNGSKGSTNAKDAAGKSDKKERQGPSSVHMSLNLAPSARPTALKKLARKSTTQETSSSSARNSVNSKANEPTVASKTRKRPWPRTAKEDSVTPSSSNARNNVNSKANEPTVASKSRKRTPKEDSVATRASAFRLPELPPPPNNQLPEDKRKNITVSSSVSCKIPNKVQRQPFASCENLSTHCRTRAKSFTVTSPFNFRSDERAEKRKEFFKKLEEKNRKDNTGKDR
ncbi:unnamed protein product [Thlaspi arvense]|uniref:TPX2 C-terminal domain-containing protein n=1 Tax=Thlaspi arvense TaxID=13288 RepID=A0AAU9RRB4_THLAR|nr:unnamed protein product [Thlaspi arvense]